MDRKLVEPFFSALIPDAAGQVAGYLYVSRIGHALIMRSKWATLATTKLDTFQRAFSRIQDDADREVFLRDEWETVAQDPAYLFAVASLITDAWWGRPRQLQWAMPPDEDWVSIVSHTYLDGRTTPLHELRPRLIGGAVRAENTIPVPPFLQLLELPRRQRRLF
jgi:hypothetical protein